MNNDSFADNVITARKDAYLTSLNPKRIRDATLTFKFKVQIATLNTIMAAFGSVI